MEKIQEAIAKARSERAALSGAPEAVQSAETVALPVQPPPTPERISGSSSQAAPPTPGAEPGTGLATETAAGRSAHATSLDALSTAVSAGQTIAPDISVDAAWAALPTFKPSESRLRRARIVTYDIGREAGDFDVMRTRIMQLQRANGWSRVAITSPTPGCGKSTLAVNLALSIARQPDKRAILCEVDFRRPTLSRFIGLRQKHAFSKVLEGRELLADNAVRIGSNLIVATNPKPVRNASEILQGDAAHVALDAITAHYRPNIVLFDLPPLLSTDDAMGFLSNVDAVILVAAAEHTTIKQIDTCEREISGQAAFMGVILNKCRYESRGSYYGSYGY